MYIPTLRYGLSLAAAATLVLFAGASPAHAQTVATTSQVWLSAAAEADVVPRLRFGVEEQLRLDESGFDQAFSELDLRYRVVPALRLGVLYRLAFLDGETRHRVGGDAELRLAIDPVTVRYRLRLEHTTRAQGAITSVRNKLKVSVDASRRVDPFASGELFYGIEPGEVREVRVSAGADVRLTKRLDLAAFYLYQREMNVNVPERHHVFGLALTWLAREVKARKSHGRDRGGDRDGDHGGARSHD